MSGSYNALYKERGGLYTNLTHSLIYFQTMCNIEERNMSESETMSMWHEYSANGGRAEFEVFYAHTRANQNLLVRASRGARMIREAKAQA